MSKIDVDKLGWPYSRLKSPDDLGWLYRNSHKWKPPGKDPFEDIRWGRFIAVWVVFYALVQVAGHVPVWAWDERGWETWAATAVALAVLWPVSRRVDRKWMRRGSGEREEHC